MRLEICLSPIKITTVFRNSPPNSTSATNGITVAGTGWAGSEPNELNYPTGNKAALPDIKDEVKNNKTIFLGPEDTARLIPTGGFSNDIASVVNETYNAFKRGK